MKKILWITLLIVLISFVFEISRHENEPGHHFWSGMPGFFIFFGFAGCLLLIIFAKALGKLLLLKDEDYYHEQ